MESNKEEATEKQGKVEKRFGVVDVLCSKLFGPCQLLTVSVQSIAVPLPVATRGVGFSATIEYNRMCDIFSIDEIYEICTLHQFYRVALHLAYYKLYLAQYEQVEMPSFDFGPAFVINEETRKVLDTVTQVSISMYNILCNIGKIEGFAIWHSIPVRSPLTDGEQAALYLYPVNIRAILERLSQSTELEFRKQFYKFNPLPGALWEHSGVNDWVLKNADEIWPPNYDVLSLHNDVRCYKNVLMRVAVRIPKFVSSFVWSGKATKSGVVSMDTVNMALRALFDSAAANQHSKKDVHGRLTQQDQSIKRTYVHDSLKEVTTEVLIWSLEHDINMYEIAAGAASLVGEHAEQPSRRQIQGRKQAYGSPGKMLHGLISLSVLPI